MLIISHRGNTIGPDPVNENKPEHILKILEKYDCEVDVWMKGSKLYLGHDNAQYEINEQFLKHPRLWCHAKNIDALYYLISLQNVKCFYHNNDNFTLTSNGLIWTYPGKQSTNRSIIVDTSNSWREKNYICCGVCVDYVL